MADWTRLATERAPSPARQSSTAVHMVPEVAAAASIAGYSGPRQVERSVAKRLAKAPTEYFAKERRAGS